MSRIDIGMLSMTTMRTGERMTFTYTAQPTTGTILARRAGIDLCCAHTTFLCLVLSTFTNQTMLPERQPTPECPASDFPLLRFGQMQILKDEHGMRRCP